MTELDVADEDDTVDDFDELAAGAAVPSITIVCDGLSKGNFLLDGMVQPMCILIYQGVSVRSWTSLLPRLPAWREEKKDAGSSSQKCECRS